MGEAKRQQIKDQVEAGEARNRARGERTLLDRAGETAIEAKDRFTAFAKEHPVATVAGGLALGVLISGLFRGSPTRKAAVKAGSRAAGLAAIGAELAMAYASQALSAAEDAGRTGADKLGHVGDRALKYGKSGTETAGEVARTAGKRIARAVHGRFN